MTDILKLREEYLKKQNPNINKMEQQQKQIFELESESLENLIKLISQKLTNTANIDESLIEEICIKLKKICTDHNNKILLWFDNKYYDDLKLLFETNLKYTELISNYEKNCFLSMSID